MRTALIRQFPALALLTILGWAGPGLSGLRAAGPPASSTASPTPPARTFTATPSPTPASAHPTATSTATPTTIPTATSTPDRAGLPQAPGLPHGVFEVLTGTGQVPVPGVRLSWYPAEPGDYLIRSYRVYRATAGAGSSQRWGEGADGKNASLALSFDDPARIGDAYDYFVVAVDSKGREGARSPTRRVDLGRLPPDELAPPAPQGLSATSREDDVKLRWGRAVPWISPWSAYRVYRATRPAGLKRGFLVSLTASAAEDLEAVQASTSTARALSSTARDWNSFADFSKSGSTPSGSGGSFFGTPPSAAQAGTATAQAGTATAQASTATAQAGTVTAQAAAPPGNFFYYYDSTASKKTDYYYAVTSLDQAGHESPMGLTVLARATGPLPPGMPEELSATSRTEQVLLNWQSADPGTSPLSGYMLNRRAVDSEYWKKVAFLGVSATTYSDSLDGGAYIYRLTAVDADGDSGDAAYVGASPTAKILNNTLVITMPSAYADNPGRDTGFNLNVLFDFYVGSLFESYTNPFQTSQTQSSIFQELEIGTVSTDLKYAFLNDRGWVPGFATGLYTSALIGFGGGAGETVGISNSGGNLDTLGDVYAVVSKRLDGNPNAAVHAGIMHGDLAQDLTQYPVPSWAWPTIHHLMPGGAIPELLSSFVDPALGQAVGQSPNMLFFGLQFPFTLPLGFTRWRSGLRIEGLFPMAWEAEYPPSETGPSGIDTGTENGKPASQLPYLINIHIDNLPLFGFEFGLFEFNGGYEVIAFYHIPDLTWSW